MVMGDCNVLILVYWLWGEVMEGEGLQCSVSIHTHTMELSNYPADHHYCHTVFLCAVII